MTTNDGKRIRQRLTNTIIMDDKKKEGDHMDGECITVNALSSSYDCVLSIKINNDDENEYYNVTATWIVMRMKIFMLVLFLDPLELMAQHNYHNYKFTVAITTSSIFNKLLLYDWKIVNPVLKSLFMTGS